MPNVEKLTTQEQAAPLPFSDRLLSAIIAPGDESFKIFFEPETTEWTRSINQWRHELSQGPISEQSIETVASHLQQLDSSRLACLGEIKDMRSTLRSTDTNESDALNNAAIWLNQQVRTAKCKLLLGVQGICLQQRNNSPTPQERRSKLILNAENKFSAFVQGEMVQVLLETPAHFLKAREELDAFAPGVMRFEDYESFLVSVIGVAEMARVFQREGFRSVIPSTYADTSEATDLFLIPNDVKDADAMQLSLLFRGEETTSSKLFASATRAEVEHLLARCVRVQIKAHKHNHPLYHELQKYQQQYAKQVTPGNNEKPPLTYQVFHQYLYNLCRDDKMDPPPERVPNYRCVYDECTTLRAQVEKRRLFGDRPMSYVQADFDRALFAKKGSGPASTTNPGLLLPPTKGKEIEQYVNDRMAMHDLIERITITEQGKEAGQMRLRAVFVEVGEVLGRQAHGSNTRKTAHRSSGPMSTGDTARPVLRRHAG